MNANAKKWVKALKSGKFKRTTGTLRDEKGFCCLGVACEIAVKNKIINKGDKRESLYFYADEENFLPEVVKNWLGLQTFKGNFKDKQDGRISLDVLNDRGKTFKQIAKIIESEPEGLFV